MQRLPRPRGRNHLRLQKSEDSGAAGGYRVALVLKFTLQDPLHPQMTTHGTAGSGLRSCRGLCLVATEAAVRPLPGVNQKHRKNDVAMVLLSLPLVICVRLFLHDLLADAASVGLLRGRVSSLALRWHIWWLPGSVCSELQNKDNGNETATLDGSRAIKLSTQTYTNTCASSLENCFRPCYETRSLIDLARSNSKLNREVVSQGS